MNKIDPKGYGFHADQGALITSLMNAERYRCLSAAGLAIGTVSKKTFKIVNTVTFLNNGVFKSKTTAAVALTATSHDIAANASTVQEAVYLVSLQADGTPVVTKGTTATGSGNAKLPNCPTGETAIGYVRIAVAAGATSFDATSDDLDAAHLTCTYVDLGYYHPLVGSES